MVITWSLVAEMSSEVSKEQNMQSPQFSFSDV